ncbi:HEPN domain-containing protein [Conexibacter arvalis]|uniref:ApeA N-terminal domain-containing protein n=1 Tax=Conexibacter arvalis TaxID=912552 RepID=A0A840IC14_9ACTN|nr:hypothetical protein [Conexibacter arvalis]
MVNTHEYRGRWWVPSDEANQVAGTLTIAKGEASLELIGHFGHQLLSETEQQKVYSFDLAEHPRLVGLTTSGKPVTLEGHQAAAYTESWPGVPTATYRWKVALIGKKFVDAEEIGFDEIALQVSDLNSWTQMSGFKTQLGMEKHEKGYTVPASVEVRYEVPDDIEIPLARGERAFIRFRATSQGLGARTDAIALTQQASLHLRFRRRASLREVFTRVAELRNFFTFAAGRPSTILAVTGFQDDFVRAQADEPIPIEILWGIPHNPDPPSKRRDPSEMLFPLAEATPDISTVMRKWFARQARLEPVFNLFFGTLHHPDLYLEVRFLSYAQAVETYDFRRRRQPGNKTLAERVRDVLDQCRTVSAQIVGSTSADQKAFIAAFKDARNYYTHYNPKLERRAARGAALVLLTIQLQAIIEMSLLRQLGFRARSIDAILARVRRYEKIEQFRQILAEAQAPQRRSI